MTVDVYVWLPSGDDHGHASISFDETYISFWPSSESSAFKDKLVNPSGKGNVKDFVLGVNHRVTLSRRYDVDRRLLRREPDFHIKLNRMDESSMKEVWQSFKDKPAPYNTYRSNCSTIIASFLELGSGVPYGNSPCVYIREYVSHPLKQFMFKLRFLGNSIEMWRPDDIRRYALQIKSVMG